MELLNEYEGDNACWGEDSWEKLVNGINDLFEKQS